MVRLATIEDLEQVLEIYQDAKEKFRNDNCNQWTDEYPSAKSFKEDIEKNKVYVFEDDGLLLGVATAQFTPDENYDEIDGKWLNDQNYVSIHRLATRKGYYRKGVCYRIFVEIGLYCKRNGINNIRIDTHKNNVVMLKILNHLAFTEVGIIKLKNRNDTDDNERIAFHKVIRPEKKKE